MILIYPNCYGLPVLKQTSYDDFMRVEDFGEDKEENNMDIFKQADDEYVNETIKKK